MEPGNSGSVVRAQVPTTTENISSNATSKQQHRRNYGYVSAGIPPNSLTTGHHHIHIFPRTPSCYLSRGENNVHRTGLSRTSAAGPVLLGPGRSKILGTGSSSLQSSLEVNTGQRVKSTTVQADHCHRSVVEDVIMEAGDTPNSTGPLFPTKGEDVKTLTLELVRIYLETWHKGDSNPSSTSEGKTSIMSLSNKQNLHPSVTESSEVSNNNVSASNRAKMGCSTSTTAETHYEENGVQIHHIQGEGESKKMENPLTSITTQLIQFQREAQTWINDQRDLAWPKSPTQSITTKIGSSSSTIEMQFQIHDGVQTQIDQGEYATSLVTPETSISTPIDTHIGSSNSTTKIQLQMKEPVQITHEDAQDQYFNMQTGISSNSDQQQQFMTPVETQTQIRVDGEYLSSFPFDDDDDVWPSSSTTTALGTKRDRSDERDYLKKSCRFCFVPSVGSSSSGYHSFTRLMDKMLMEKTLADQNPFNLKQQDTVINCPYSDGNNVALTDLTTEEQESNLDHVIEEEWLEF